MNDPRQLLFDAGVRLARTIGLEELDIERLCAEAGVGREAFDAAFGDLTRYVTALQQSFMDRLRNRIVAVTSGVPAGLLRIQLATETYLSNCLAERSLRGWLIEARTRPDVLAGLRRQNQAYWIVIGTELQALGWPQPHAAGRMLLAMINEASIVEHRLGQPSEDVREVIWDFLQRGGPTSR